MTEKQNGLKTNSIAENKYEMLFKGALIMKEVCGMPSLMEGFAFSMMDQKLVIVPVRPSKTMLTQAFCAIDKSEIPEIVAGILLFDAQSKKFISDISLRSVIDNGDMLACYRIMELLENLPIIDIGGNMNFVGAIPLTWPMLQNSVKKVASNDLGISLSRIKKILSSYPSDFEKQIRILEKHGIDIPKHTLQEAVLSGKIKPTDELIKKGILPIEEMVCKNKRRKHVLKPYFKHLSAYFYKYYDGALLTYDGIYCILAEKFVNDAIRIGVKDRDLILTYSLIEIDNLMVENAIPITMSLVPEIINDYGALLVRGAGENRKIEGRQRIIEFVRESFPDTGRTFKDYELFLMNLKDQVIVSRQD